MKKYIIAILLVTITVQSWAQLNPPASQYFYNQLLQSVAATGLKPMTRIDLSFRNTVPNTFMGAPVNQYVTLQSQTKSGSGFGIQMNGDNAGLLSRNRFLGSYALDLSKGATRVRLGMGLGMMMSRINNKNGSFIRGDVNDPAIADFNQQRVNIDGTIGLMLETEKGFQLLTSIPSLGNIQQFSKYDAINYTIFTGLVKKRFQLGVGGDEYVSGMSSIEPLIGYRAIHGGQDIIDVGMMINYQEWIGFLAMYHSNNEYAFGIHIPYKNKLAFNFTYNTGKVYTRNYLNTGGTLEGHVMVNLGSNKK